MSRKANLIYCNCCGNPICPKDQADKTSFLFIKKEWGYFSEEKDGTIHSMDICEPCYDTVVKMFAIPPEIKPATELL